MKSININNLNCILEYKEYKLITPNYSSIEIIGNNLRLKDLEEINFFSDKSYELKDIPELINIAVKDSNPSYVLTKKNEPIAIGGIAKTEISSLNWYSPWLVGTNQLTNNVIAYALISSYFKDIHKNSYDRLFNYIKITDSTDLLRIKWLEKLGFIVFKPNNKEVEFLQNTIKSTKNLKDNTYFFVYIRSNLCVCQQ